MGFFDLLHIALLVSNILFRILYNQVLELVVWSLSEIWIKHFSPSQRVDEMILNSLFCFVLYFNKNPSKIIFSNNCLLQGKIIYHKPIISFKAGRDLFGFLCGIKVLN